MAAVEDEQQFVALGRVWCPVHGEQCADRKVGAQFLGHLAAQGGPRALARLDVPARYVPRRLVGRLHRHDPSCAIEVQRPGCGTRASELLTLVRHRLNSSYPGSAGLSQRLLGTHRDPRTRLPSGQARRLSVGVPSRGRAGVGITQMCRRSSLVLGALPSAVPCARLHARHVLREWAVLAEVDTAELLISELVTNSLQAVWATGSDKPISLTLSAGSAVVAIEVWDGSSHPPVLRELDDDVPPLDEENGRGLFLVDTLSEKWGWYPTCNPAGKVTWCELQAPVGDSRNGRP